MLKVELEKSVEDLETKLQYKTAEIANLRRRLKDDVSLCANKTIDSVMLELLPIMDYMGRCTPGVLDKMTPGEVRILFKNTKQHFDNILSNLGVESYTTSPGSLFDINKHNAIYHNPGDGDVVNIKTSERGGYMINDRVLRFEDVVTENTTL